MYLSKSVLPADSKYMALAILVNMLSFNDFNEVLGH